MYELNLHHSLIRYCSSFTTIKTVEKLYKNLMATQLVGGSKDQIQCLFYHKIDAFNHYTIQLFFHEKQFGARRELPQSKVNLRVIRKFRSHLSNVLGFELSFVPHLYVLPSHCLNNSNDRWSLLHCQTGIFFFI